MQSLCCAGAPVSSSLANSAPARGGRRPAIQAHAARAVREAARASVLPRVAALEAAAARLGARKGAGLAAVAAQLRRILAPLAALRAPEPQPAAGAAHGAAGAACPAAGAPGAVCDSGAHDGPASCLALESSGGCARPVGGPAGELSEGCNGGEESPQHVSSCGMRLAGSADACVAWDSGAGEGSVCAHVSADAPPALSPAGSAPLGAFSLDARRPDWPAGPDDQAAFTAVAGESNVELGLAVSCASDEGALCPDSTLVLPNCHSPNLPHVSGTASALACPPPCAAGSSAAAGGVGAAGDAGGEPPPPADSPPADACGKEGLGGSGGAGKAAAGGAALFLQARGRLSTGESAPGRIGVGSPGAAAGPPPPPLARAGNSGASWGSGGAESLAAAGSGGGSACGSPTSARGAGAPGGPRALGSGAAGGDLDDSCPVFTLQAVSGWPSGFGRRSEPDPDPELLSSCAASPWFAAGMHATVQDAREWQAGAQRPPDPLRDLAGARRAWAALITQLSLRLRCGPLTLTMGPGGAGWGAAPSAAIAGAEAAGRSLTAAAVDSAADAAAAAGEERGPGLLAAVSALLQRARLAQDAAACVRG